MSRAEHDFGRFAMARLIDRPQFRGLIGAHRERFPGALWYATPCGLAQTGVGCEPYALVSAQRSDPPVEGVLMRSAGDNPSAPHRVSRPDVTRRSIPSTGSADQPTWSGSAAAPTRRPAFRRLALHPVDLLLAGTRLYSSLPVVGKYLEPFAGLTAMALWGHRHAPVAVRAALTRRVREVTRPSAEDPRMPLGGVEIVAAQINSRVPPFMRARAQRQRYLYRSAVRYGDHPAQLLDVWRLDELPDAPAPVLLFVPGGAWVQGTRALQGHTLLSHLAQDGWVCMTMNYRVSPVHTWPRHIADVNAAIAWARANAGLVGGDPTFIAIAGCSAGGHLAALAGLTSGDPAFRGELDGDANTSVDAVVGIYGRYDWQDRSTAARRDFQGFLERVIVRRSQSRHPDVFASASPLARIHRDAPPFLVVHGSEDSIIPVGEARQFQAALRAVSRRRVEYVELPAAGHAFDLVNTFHAERGATEIGRFLNSVHQSHPRSVGTSVVIH